MTNQRAECFCCPGSDRHRHSFHMLLGSGLKMKLCALCIVQKCSQPSRAMSYTTPLMSSTPSLGICTPSFPTTRPTSTSSNFLSGEIEPCADPRHVSIGYLREPTTSAELEACAAVLMTLDCKLVVRLDNMWVKTGVEQLLRWIEKKATLFPL